MKKSFKLISTFVLLTSVFLFSSNLFLGRVPKNVTIDGVEIGRLYPSQAEEKVRSVLNEKLPSLTIVTPQGERVFSYPEIGYTDDVDPIVKKAKRNTAYHAHIVYYLRSSNEVLERLCDEIDRLPIDACADFDGEFTYYPEKEGVLCDREQLKKDVAYSLENGFSPVYLRYRSLPAEKTTASVKEETRLLSSFTTYFDGTNRPRAKNISLAAERINGYTLSPGESFSFNAVVGKRTKENGFRIANVISEGRYAPGIGGGVCQASTTVYNAALLAGMRVTSVNAHSLTVSYIEPSFDAMVSEQSDMSFYNPLSCRIYLAATVGYHSITVKFYGKQDGHTYERHSEVIKATEGTEKDRGRLTSEGSLFVYKDGEFLEKRPLRRDEYKLPTPVAEKKEESATTGGKEHNA